MKALFTLALIAFFLPAISFAKPCGHISQLGHAIGCLRSHANAAHSEGNAPHSVYVSASDRAQAGLKAMIKDYRGRDLTRTKKEELVKLVGQTEWFGLVVEWDDEPIFHYYFLNSGEAPKEILDFNPTDAGSLVFPELYKQGDVGPFVLYLRKGIVSDDVYEIIETGMKEENE